MKHIAYSLLLSSALFAHEVSHEQALAYRARAHSTFSKSSAQASCPFNRGDDLLPNTAAAAYNAPAGTLLNHSYSSLISDFYIDAAFLYYFARQEGLNLATSGQVLTPTVAPNITSTAITNGTFLTQDFAFKPGFKLGLGMNIAEWCLAADYTWIHQTTHTNQAAPMPISTSAGEGVWVTNNWFQQTYPLTALSMAGSAIASTWNLGMDIVDVSASRPFYEAKNLTVSPFFGLRSAWIRQQVKVNLTNNAALGTSVATIQSSNSSNSWSIGPRTGFAASCLLGKGFRFDGDASASLLYTEFTHVHHQENSAFSANPLISALDQTNIHTVRPELELGLGLGWGTYFAKQRYHLDLAAGYDFLVFWEQNMIRKNLDEAIMGVSTSANNLYLHGLNLTARFNF